jgi:hypothetical protein
MMVVIPGTRGGEEGQKPFAFHLTGAQSVVVAAVLKRIKAGLAATTAVGCFAPFSHCIAAMMVFSRLCPSRKFLEKFKIIIFSNFSNFSRNYFREIQENRFKVFFEF